MKVGSLVAAVLAVVVLATILTMTLNLQAREDISEVKTKHAFLFDQAVLLENVLGILPNESLSIHNIVQPQGKDWRSLPVSNTETKPKNSDTLKPDSFQFARAQQLKSYMKIEPNPESSEKQGTRVYSKPAAVPRDGSNRKSTAVTPPTSMARAPVGNTGAKLHIVTYASHGGRDDRFCRALESAYHHNIQLTILGWGVKWTGLSQKLYAAYNYAKSIPPTDVILFVDAFDVMFASTPDRILDEFLSSPSNVLVFAAECGCWPQIMENRGYDCFHAYPKSPTPYRYLNSGTWIGVAKVAAEMLLDIIDKAGENFANANDQKLVSDMFIKKKHQIRLDYYSKIFQSMHMTDAPLAHCAPAGDITTPEKFPISFQYNSSGTPVSYYNKVTKSVPAVYHFNGGGKTYHLRYEAGMWYRGKQKQQLLTKTRESVFEGVAGYRLRIIPQIEGSLKESDIHFMKLQELCPSYISNLMTNSKSLG